MTALRGTMITEIEQQLKILEVEIETINGIAARMDEITQKVKNWAVITWAGSIALLLGNQSLRVYLPLTGVLPLLFMFTDIQWRYLQRRSMFRIRKISEFLNDGRLGQSITEGRLVSFLVLDPAAKTYKGDHEYQSYVSRRRVLTFPEIAWFYPPMSLLSVVFSVVIRVCS